MLINGTIRPCRLPAWILFAIEKLTNIIKPIMMIWIVNVWIRKNCKGECISLVLNERMLCR